MKTSLRVVGLGVAMFGLTLGLTGCGEDNDKASLAAPAGTPATGKNVTPPGVPRSSSAAYEAMQKNNPMNNSGYRQATQ